MVPKINVRCVEAILRRVPQRLNRRHHNLPQNLRRTFWPSFASYSSYEHRRLKNQREGSDFFYPKVELLGRPFHGSAKTTKQESIDRMVKLINR